MLVDELEPCATDVDNEQAFTAWANSFERKESAFTNELINGLHHFLPEDNDTLCARVRRSTIVHDAPSTSTSVIVA